LRSYFGEFHTAGPKDRECDGKKENKGVGKLRKEKFFV
jgi:hypothetical protein